MLVYVEVPCDIFVVFYFYVVCHGFQCPLFSPDTLTVGIFYLVNESGSIYE